jgi:hypothetical protein
VFFLKRLLKKSKENKKRNIYAEFNLNEWEIVYPNDPNIQSIISDAASQQEEIWFLYPPSKDDQGFRKVIPQSIHTSQEGNITFFCKKIEGSSGESAQGDNNREYSFNKVKYFLFRKEFLGVDPQEKEIIEDTYVDSVSENDTIQGEQGTLDVDDDRVEEMELPYDDEINILENATNEEKRDKLEDGGVNVLNQDGGENVEKAAKKIKKRLKYIQSSK